MQRQACCWTPGAKSVLDSLKYKPEIAPFVLIGGAALAVHFAHRVVNCLDFVFVGSEAPYQAIASIVQGLADRGHKLLPIAPRQRGDECDRAGLGLQAWSVERATLTFSVAESRLGWMRASALFKLGYVSVLAPEALFELKARLLAGRLASGDLFDLWFYLQHQGRTVREVFEMARWENPYCDDKVLRARLLPSLMSRTDPGFVPQISGAPKNFRELRERLMDFMDVYEREVACEVALEELRRIESPM